MKKIIVPTDFSDNAYNALRYAVQLLKDEICTFYILNTYTPVVYDPEYLNTAATLSLTEIAQRQSMQGLEDTFNRIKNEFNNPNHRFETISAFNYLSDELQIQTEEKDIDLIIMGTQGATGAKEVIFGSQTMHVIKVIKCPLLAVPSAYKYRGVDAILLPNDFQMELEENRLRILKVLASKKNSKLENYFEGISKEFHFVQSDSLVESINKLEKQLDIDMLVMMNNKHSFFENLLFQPAVENIGFHTQIPFLIIPSGKYRGFSLF
jgi:nucleotide-binding universal stress UspA family protein